ncbi:MAG: aminopeptidase, partial [Erythrobacter sp.]|nr:aminopeptidase [Erythrobacter sp.]
MRLFAVLFALLVAFPAYAQGIQQTKGDFEDKFRQLDEVLRSPNVYRTASGAPGHQYWQQEADYTIAAELDEDGRRLTAKGTITYTNNSPDTLPWIWLQLDQNRFRTDSMHEMADPFGGLGRYGPGRSPASGDRPARLSLRELQRQQALDDRPYGYEIASVTLTNGRALDYTIVGTLMRIDLAAPLRPGASVSVAMEWAYNILEETPIRARQGFEHFPDDPREGGNDIFMFAQWFPRLVAYSDYEGWHNKEFLGAGQFTLEFGDYDVTMTVPNDHIVSSTGVLANPDAVLTATQRQRLAKARNADAPVFIVTPKEAEANEATDPTGMKTWRFTADNVRDFAWASSRKFAWDAQGHKQPGAEHETVMAMSFYPKEGGELW